ncbi:sporulation protein YhbH [Limnochorda pilosa]|uniref:Stress response protein n=1 Tax=Limnochorda pilosa TaxID=1555112 RepID=A0A0K2SQE2_LIMPI|nr:sporulation protein YhbH [Limnochorda pilosa]BAS29049.1 stress response protein [Limnochorda pilosa]
MHPRSFLVSRDDWSLHRQGEMDQKRHQEKVREAIRENLADLVSEESIIMSDGRKVVKVPIRSLEEYKFRFDPHQGEHAGSGQGGTEVGKVLGPARPAKGAQAPGQGPGAGDQPGFDYYEAEVTVDELAELIFQDLGLPNLKQKRRADIESTYPEFTDVRKQGLQANVDKRRTLLEALRRAAREGHRGLQGIRREDLRFKTWEERVRTTTSAVVMAMMDTSGSMGTFEKYIARSFYFWMVRFLRTRYHQVQIVFIAHDTRAREVSEEEFFSKGESGGTKCSSAYEKALEIVEERFPPEDYNIYPFHFSDGDNFPSDNVRCVKLMSELIERSSAVGYGEITSGRYYRESTLMSAFERLEDPRFTCVQIRSKDEVYPALKRFFRRSEEVPHPGGLAG